jgi:hypothetical protein
MVGGRHRRGAGRMVHPGTRIELTNAIFEYL